MNRRDRLTTIIRALSQREPTLTVTIGNHCQVNPFLRFGPQKDPDALAYMTEEGLEIVARFLVEDRACTNRNNERNRALLRAAAE